MDNVPDFSSMEDAYVWLDDQVDDPCIDNYRFAYSDDMGQVGRFEDIKTGGCCGSADYNVTVNGRAAIIGCNYGH